MPEMDGLEASRQIRERLPPERRPVVVALSADTMQVSPPARPAQQHLQFVCSLCELFAGVVGSHRGIAPGKTLSLPGRGSLIAAMLAQRRPLGALRRIPTGPAGACAGCHSWSAAPSAIAQQAVQQSTLTPHVHTRVVQALQERCLAAGIAEFIAKPFRLEDVKRVLQLVQQRTVPAAITVAA